MTHLHSLVQVIRKLGASPGVALNPATPASTLEEMLPALDLVLAMTVNPGYGGQAFIPGVLSKITKLRAMIDAAGLSTELEVDGGVKADNVGLVIGAGADVIVAGSAVYNDKMTIAEAITNMKNGIGASSIGKAS